jgi:hypothetical protein
MSPPDLPAVTIGEGYRCTCKDEGSCALVAGGGARTLATVRDRPHDRGMDDMPARSIVPFGAVMLMLVGAFNALDGVVAIANPDYFEDHLLFADIKSWGWFFLVFGVLQFVVGFLVLAGSAVALWPGVALAAVNALTQLAFVDSRPAWSLAIVALDVLVIYGFVGRGMALGVTEAERREPAQRSDGGDVQPMVRR